jgi:acetyl esterase/lipase
MMMKYLLITLFMVLLSAGIWFFRLGGPAQLELADRWYWGGDERKRAVVEIDIHYGPGGDPEQQYDVYHPIGAGPIGEDCTDRKYPTLIFFHGGSWRDGNKDSYGFVGRAFAERGFYVVVANYRKLPKARFPDFVEDAARVIANVHKTVRPCADESKLYLMGHSAGAHIAMLAVLARKWLAAEGLDGTIISGVIGLAGPYDFYPFTSEAAQAALGAWPTPQETQPISYASKNAPPLLLLHGSRDETVKPRNSRILAAAVNKAGGAAETRLYQGIDHADIVMAIARPFRKKAPVIEDAIAFMVND